MRKSIQITLGGQDYDLLPSFAVADAFEDRFGSLAAHIQKLIDLSAPMNQRAYLIMQALKAAQPEEPWALDAVKKTMFERGYWHEDLVRIECDLIEQLLYTPEQYQEKKARRQEAAAQEAELARILSGFDPSSPMPLQT